ncbi:MAG: hypothetical protein PHQ64_04615 [Bacilli bacterium]|nr:hypothetical protein [Bacilli bacterium]
MDNNEMLGKIISIVNAKNSIEVTYEIYEKILNSLINPSEIINLKDNSNKKNIGYVISNLIATNFLINKENIIEKDGKNFHLLIYEKPIIEVLKNYAEFNEEDNTFIISNVTYKNVTDLINTIRNKFAHGKTRYDENTSNIIMKSNGEILSIPIELLIKINDILFINNNTKKTKINIDTKWINTPKKLKSSLETKEDYLEFFNECTYTSYSIKKTDNTNKEVNHNEKIEEFINGIKNNINFNYREIEKLEEIIKTYCIINNLSYDKKTIFLDKNQKEMISKKIDILVKKHSNISIDNRKKIILTFISDELNNGKTIDYMSKCNEFILEYINYLSNNDFEGSLEKFSHYKKGLGLEILNKIVPYLQIMKFNSLYSFNVENFDQSLLDFSNIEFKNEEIKLNEQSNPNLNKVIRNIDQIDQRISKINNKKQKTEDEEKLLLELLDTKKQLLEKQKDILEDMSLRSKHYYNKNIIEHLRNAIAHGNFEIQFVGLNINDFKINLKDIYEDKVTFEMNTTLDTFMNLTSNKRKEELISFLGKELVAIANVQIEGKLK